MAITEFAIRPTIPTAPLGITADAAGKVWFVENDGNLVCRLDPSTLVIDTFDIPTANSKPIGIALGPDGNIWFAENGANQIAVLVPSSGVVTEFPTPTGTSGPFGVTAGPDGGVWFTESGADRIGRIDPTTHAIIEVPIGGATNTEPMGITTGPDGNIWFVEASGNQIGKLDPTTHAITEFPVISILSGLIDITTGPDGNLWFTEASSTGNNVGRIDPHTGVVTEFPMLAPDSDPIGIATGNDGNLWCCLSDNNNSRIAKITTAGVVTEFPVPTTAGEPRSIVAVGTDMWFTEQNGNQVGRIPNTGSPVVEIAIPGGIVHPTGITVGPGNDGRIWFAEHLLGSIGGITTSGTITHFPIPTADSGPNGVCAGPDGNIWFTENAANQIGKLEISSGSITEFAVPTANSFPNAITSGTDGKVYFIEEAGNNLGQIDPASHAVVEFAIPTAACFPHGVTTGPDGKIWFTEGVANKIAQFDPASNTFQEFTVPTAGSHPEGITADETSIWFSESSVQKIGRFKLATATFDEFKAADFGNASDLTLGPDGNVWFVNPSESLICQLVPGFDPLTFKTPNKGSFPSAIVTGPDGNLWFTEQFSDAIGSGLGVGSVPPVVTSIVPTSGIISGGTPVTITGTGFTGVTGVFFGGAPAASFTFVSARQVVAVSPPGGGTVDVVVDTAVGSSAAVTADRFSYIGPFISLIAPASGSSAGGDTVTLGGSGFTGVTQVSFGSASAAFTFISDSKLTAISPPGTGSVDVTITTPAATSAPVPFHYLQPVVTPSVTGVSPTSGSAAGGDTVTITGSGFTGATAVNFGGVPAASATVVSDTQILAISPAGSGIVDITVQTSAGTSSTGAADQFTYSGAAPTVTGVSPNSGSAAGGDSIDITGAGFTGVAAVNFGATAAASFSFVSDTEITAVSPAGSGAVDITASTVNGVSNTGAADQFTYNPAEPAITSIDPATGSGDGGDTVTVSGTGFTGVSAVNFGGNPAASFTFVSDSQVTAVSPAGTGMADITVTTPAGDSPAVAADQFTWTAPPPALSGISPNSGSPGGGDSVDITGTGFTGVTGVSFGGNAAASFSFVSDTEVTAVSPAGAGTVDVTVTTPAGASATEFSDQFTYNPSPPNVTGIDPTGGTTDGGDTVTISGSGFTGASGVSFGGSPAASINFISDSQVTAVSPSGSGTVDIMVTTPTATSAAVAADQFTYS